MSHQQIPGLYFAPSDSHGLGVFCSGVIMAGDLIEIAPMLLLDDASREALDRSNLYNYYFMAGLEFDTPALALGYGSLYNHSADPNATFAMDSDNSMIHFTALHKIEAGQEIRINYHDGIPDQPVWFTTNE